MILKIKLSKVEYFEFVNISRYYFDLSKQLLNSWEYLHFYNLKSIVQKAMKKQIFEVDLNRKMYVLNLSINEYESFKHIYKIAEIPNDYTNIVIHNIFTTLDKQNLDNNHILICNINGKKEHTNYSN